MALKITNECVNCGACEPECPNTAIYEGGAEWTYSEGTNLSGTVKGLHGKHIDVERSNKPIVLDWYFIVKDKCTECYDYTSEPQCLAVCPVESYETHKETVDELQTKIKWLFGTDKPYLKKP